jgi:hypothetical protein
MGWASRAPSGEELKIATAKDGNLALTLGSKSMRAHLLATPILGAVLISNAMIAHADPLAGSAPDRAPVVQVQPRAEDFQPHSPASEAEQHRLSVFDAKQHERDEAFDKKLDICRC